LLYLIVDVVMEVRKDIADTSMLQWTDTSFDLLMDGLQPIDFTYREMMKLIQLKYSTQKNICVQMKDFLANKRQEAV
jgi:hypothetical protein